LYDPIVAGNMSPFIMAYIKATAMNDVQAAALFQQNPSAFAPEFRQGTITTKAGVSVPVGPDGRRIKPATFHAAARRVLFLRSSSEASSLNTPGSPSSPDTFETPRDSPGLQHASEEMTSALSRKHSANVEGVVGNVVRAATQVKDSPQTEPPDPANFHAHVNAVAHNELQNIAEANPDDEVALQAVTQAMSTIPRPSPASALLQGTTVLSGFASETATPDAKLAKLGSAPAGKLSPQQLFSAADIPLDANRSPSLTRPSAINHSVEHSTVVTNDALLSLTEQMEQMALDSQIRIDMHGEQLAALDTLNTAGTADF
jgi:hypothetical protein